jgi:glutamyl-tRNA synthetase
LPAALVNGLALLGWNPPSREDPNVLSQDPAALQKSEMLYLSELEGLFSIGKVGKSGVKFDERKLEFLNSMHIRDKFAYYEDLDERRECVREFREVMTDTLDPSLHKRIRQTSDKNMLRIMDMMKQRIHFYSDLKNHTYFFVEPLYNTERSAKFQKRLSQPQNVQIEILEDILVLFEKL